VASGSAGAVVFNGASVGGGSVAGSGY